MAGHPLRPATDRRLGRPLPCQLANRTWAHLAARALRPPFPRRSYAVLARVSPGCPPLPGRFPRITHPSATLLSPKAFRVRLACVRHAASVQSEPGSNSSVQFIRLSCNSQFLAQQTLLPKMLVDLSGHRPGTSEHPHKLSKQIVKELRQHVFAAKTNHSTASSLPVNCIGESASPPPLHQHLPSLRTTPPDLSQPIIIFTSDVLSTHPWDTATRSSDSINRCLSASR